MSTADEVKDIRSGEQTAAEAGTWTVGAEDRRVRILAPAAED